MILSNRTFCGPLGLYVLGALGLLHCGGFAIDCLGGGECQAAGAGPGSEIASNSDREPVADAEVVEPYCVESDQLGDPLQPFTVQDWVVETQAQIDALAGCREIWGSLSITGELGTDLTPLSNLERIEGPFTILGAGDPENSPLPRLDDLSGLSALQYVGSLSLQSLAVTSLEVFRNLSQVGPSPGDEGRIESFVYDGIYIEDCDELPSLRGLRGVNSYRSLVLTDNERLTDFGDLKRMLELSSFNLVGNPVLLTISHAPQRVRTSLYIGKSLFVSLEPLAPVQSATTVSIFENAWLEDLDGLRDLQNFREMTIRDNPALWQGLNFPNVTSFTTFELANNRALRAGPQFPNMEVVARGKISITGNKSLATLNGFSELKRARTLIVSENPSLVSLDLSSLNIVSRTLEIRCNPLLPASAVTSLSEVDSDAVNLDDNGLESSDCVLP